MDRRWRTGAVVLGSCLMAVLGGCRQPGASITGSQNATQSETAAASSYNGRNILVVTYNDETDSGSTIQYTATNRTILHGASLLGWSYSTDVGATWKYGGKLAPPKGWAALWGDPALTTSPAAYRYVFLSNLAIPDSKFPAGGIQGSVIVSGADSYVGGACIARSTDGGVTFQIYQCFNNTTPNSVPNSAKGHFYDGGSMAAARSGEVFAAYVDVATNQIDVWRSPSLDGKFAQLPPPFPNMDMQSHPVLRVDPGTGALYVAAQAANAVVFMNRFANGQWMPAVQASDPGVLYPCVAYEQGACLGDSSNLSIRTAEQFSFDIGAASDASGKDAIRLLYTRQDPNNKSLYVTGAFCPLSLSPGCWGAPEWGTTPGNLSIRGDEYNPNVSTWPGFIGLPPAWKGTYLHREAPLPSKVSLSQGNLAYLPDGGRIYVPFDVISNQPICPDNRGYWGDYDDLMVAGFKNGSTTPSFLRTMSDSSAGCDKRWDYTSSQLHVRAFVFE